MSVERTPPQQVNSYLEELRAIRRLLERQFKPPTIQGVVNAINVPAGALGGFSAQANMILDHDDDRLQIILLLRSATGTLFLKFDDGNIATSLIPGVFQPISLQPLLIGGSAGIGVSNRLFGVGAAADFDLLVSRVDRFPRSTR